MYKRQVYADPTADTMYSREGDTTDDTYTNDDTSKEHRYNNEDMTSSYITTVKYNKYSHTVYTMLPALYNMSTKNVPNELQLNTIVFPSSSSTCDEAVTLTVSSRCALSNGYNADNHEEYVPSSEFCHRDHTITKHLTHLIKCHSIRYITLYKKYKLLLVTEMK